MQETQDTQGQSVGQEDPLEKAMTTYSPGGLQSMGSQRVRHNWATEHTHAGKVEWVSPGGEKKEGKVILRNTRETLGEGNGTPLQYSRLENPMDGGAWGAIVHEVTESDTTERLPFHFSLLCIGEGNGNPLQCSCLENPRDGGAL